jgi:hypothetical protein
VKSINELLEREMSASEEFTKSNFGLKVGDDFPELAREICRGGKLPLRLIIGVVMGALMGKSLAEEMAALPRDQRAKLDMGPIVLRNIELFELPLSLLYWGIQIGRKTEREEVGAMQRMENQQ